MDTQRNWKGDGTGHSSFPIYISWLLGGVLPEFIKLGLSLAHNISTSISVSLVRTQEHNKDIRKRRMNIIRT